MDAAAELGRNPVSKHRIHAEYGDEQADAGWDCRTRLARPNPQARTNTDREIFIFPVQLTMGRICSLTRLIHTLDICVTIHHGKHTNAILYAIINTPHKHIHARICRERWRTRENVARGGRRNNGRIARQRIVGYLASRGTRAPRYSLTLGSGTAQ